MEETSRRCEGKANKGQQANGLLTAATTVAPLETTPKAINKHS